ncbi:hypothetical protein PFISCL1PPCAC_28714, partial [Pristionchus fissidentatus]
ADEITTELSDVVCVGTSKGSIACFLEPLVYDSAATPEPHYPFSVDGCVKGLVVDLFEDPKVLVASLNYGLRFCVLTARQVCVRLLHVSCTALGVITMMLESRDLFHLVSSPTHLSIESSIYFTPNNDENNNQARAGADVVRRDRVERIVVSGGDEHQVLLMCPLNERKKVHGLHPLYAAIEVLEAAQKKKKKKSNKKKEKKSGSMRIDPPLKKPRDFPDGLLAVYTTSIADVDASEPTASVIGVHAGGVTAATFGHWSTLTPNFSIDLNSAGTNYEYSCSALLATAGCTYLVVGCKGGELLLLQAPDSSMAYKMITNRKKCIDQITTYSDADVREQSKLMFAVRTGDSLSVWSVLLAGAKRGLVDRLADIPICSEVDGASTVTLIGMGSLSLYDTWLFTSKKVAVWSDDEDGYGCLWPVIGGEISAGAVVNIHARDEKKCGHPFMTLICFGTTEGKIGCAHFVDTLKVWIEIDGVEGEVKGLASEVCEQVTTTAGKQRSKFGILVYILTADRVVVRRYAGSIRHATMDELQMKPVGERQLLHAVIDPTHLAVERHEDPMNPQRVVVSGLKGYEVLLCRARIQPVKNPLEVSSTVKAGCRGEKKHEYVLRNNTNRKMHVSVSSSTLSDLFGQPGDWRLGPREEVAFQMSTKLAGGGMHPRDSMTMSWRLEKSVRRREQQGEVTVAVITN